MPMASKLDQKSGTLLKAVQLDNVYSILDHLFRYLAHICQEYRFEYDFLFPLGFGHRKDLSW